MILDNKIPEIFQYKEIEVPKDCYHKISPSQITKFFEYPKVYYEENILKKPFEFQGNTSTVLGTICHYIYKCVTLGQEITKDEINEQLIKYATQKPGLNLDVQEIINNYPLVSSAVVNEYILPNSKANLIKVEEQVLVELGEGIYIGGTYDRLEGDCIVDYKNVSKLPNTITIPFNYKIQLLAYAWMLRKKGYEVNRIRIVYGITPTKTIGARCIVITEEVDYMADKLINDTIQLIEESIIICKYKPELIHLIFKSMDLKQ